MGTKIKKLAKKLQAFSDPKRLEILCILFKVRKVCVSDIAKRLKLDIAVVSYHLQTLSQEKLVEPIREGKMICYVIKQNDLTKDLKYLICKHGK